jgi:hypothetical protein
VGFVFATMTTLLGSKSLGTSLCARSNAPKSSSVPSAAQAINTLCLIWLAIAVVARMRC